MQGIDDIVVLVPVDRGRNAQHCCPQ
jgi:hypothetical protein